MFATVSVFAQAKVDAWNEFRKTKVRDPKYLEKIGSTSFIQRLRPKVKALAGKEVTIEGFYVPFTFGRRQLH